MQSPKLSIVIPCYNSSIFITETLESILCQDEKNFEVILVDDGSTDDTKKIIHSFISNRIQYVYQKNQGVSIARNNGFTFAKGQYVVFFDADDIMTSGFLSGRRRFLDSNADTDFICGTVQKFNENGIIEGYYRGTSSNLEEEILLYNSEVVTCPSNYMFRAEFLKLNNLSFNTILSSTADKYFLLQCAKLGKPSFDSGLALNYRVAKNSMSHNLTSTLILDNEIYYEELVKNDLIPKSIQNKSLFLGFFILFASYWKVNSKRKSFKYAIRSFLINPIGFVKKCVI